MTRNEILRQVDEVIQTGPYRDTWESLCEYPVPKWYRDAKFGVFIHWGVYSVPAYDNEWYPHHMYLKDHHVNKHHRETYGPPDKFGYTDFIPMFKGEKFDAREWVALMGEAGAKFFMPVAEHHDGFQMYDSSLSKWNAKQMGPRRDVIGELRDAASGTDVAFTLSSHRAEHCWFFKGGLDYPCDVTDPAYFDFYGEQFPLTTYHDIYHGSPPVDHCEDWLARCCELADKYRPKVFWFDWWIHNTGFIPYLKKFTAYYYNRAAEWGEAVAINYKYNAYPRGAAVYDVERGLLSGIQPRFWQTDTSVNRAGCTYTDRNDFKDPRDLVRDLIDTVSKNGCMLLNIGPKSDGTISDEETYVLRSMGQWLKRNGEGIYGSTFWDVYGEGPSDVPSGYFTDNAPVPYTAEDIRFTYKGGAVYAFVMKWPDNGKIRIKSLRREFPRHNTGDFNIKEVSLVGFENKLSYERDEDALRVSVEGKLITDYPVCLKITRS